VVPTGRAAGGEAPSSGAVRRDDSLDLNRFQRSRVAHDTPEAGGLTDQNPAVGFCEDVHRSRIVLANVQPVIIFLEVGRLLRLAIVDRIGNLRVTRSPKPVPDS